jgi:hypothetical protein
VAVLTRVARSRSAVLTHVWYVGETPTDPTGTPTAVAVDANGDTVTIGSVTVVGGGSGEVHATLAAQADLCAVTVTWTAVVSGDTVSEVDYVEVVGGFFFTLPQVRASDATLADPGKYPTADLEARRVEVEVECEEICDRAFVPRYAREVLDGSGTSDLVLAHAEVRTIRRAAMATRPGGAFTDLTSAQLLALAPRDDRTLRRSDGGVWTGGWRNIVVEYEYGLDRPATDLVDAAMIRLRTLINRPKSGIPDRATSFVVAEGGTFRISQPGPWTVGIPDVDAAYARYSLREGAGASGADKGRAAPFSRTLQYAPQRDSLFHRRW